MLTMEITRKPSLVSNFTACREFYQLTEALPIREHFAVISSHVRARFYLPDSMLIRNPAHRKTAPTLVDGRATWPSRNGARLVRFFIYASTGRLQR